MQSARKAAAEKGLRFVAVKGSFTVHCCFLASVIDTTKKGLDSAVCECFDMRTALQIAGILNAALKPWETPVLKRVDPHHCGNPERGEV